MSKAEEIKDNAHMVLSDLAFCFSMQGDNKYIKIYNVNDIEQTTLVLVRNDGSLLLKESNMSEADMYKGLFIAERNKQELLYGFKQWESAQRI